MNYPAEIRHLINVILRENDGDGEKYHRPNKQFDGQSPHFDEIPAPDARAVQLLRALDEGLVLFFAGFAAKPARGARHLARVTEWSATLLAPTCRFDSRMINAIRRNSQRHFMPSRRRMPRMARTHPVCRRIAGTKHVGRRSRSPRQEELCHETRPEAIAPTGPEFRAGNTCGVTSGRGASGYFRAKTFTLSMR